MKTYFSRIVVLFLALILLTACPSDFDNRLDKNVEFTMQSLLGSWDSKYFTLNISPTIIKGNYFANATMKKGGAVHEHIMHVTQIDDKFYASLIQKGNIKHPRNYIIQFSIAKNVLKTKILNSTENSEHLSPKKLEAFIRSNANSLTYDEEYSINYNKK